MTEKRIQTFKYIQITFLRRKWIFNYNPITSINSKLTNFIHRVCQNIHMEKKKQISGRLSLILIYVLIKFVICCILYIGNQIVLSNKSSRFGRHFLNMHVYDHPCCIPLIQWPLRPWIQWHINKAIMRNKCDQ